MEPMTFLTIMAGIAWINNVYDYVSFSYKHHKTQEELKNVKGELSSLKTSIDYMRQEIRENNKNIKELNNIMDNKKIELNNK